MENNGTKIVFAMVGLAVLLGLFSWWYRYEAAHRASQFWGPTASRLIAESAGFEATAYPAAGAEVTDLSHVRGQAHLRHALLSDGNYLWDQPVTADEVDWRWRLRFYEAGREARVLLASDLKTIGKQTGESQIEAYSCAPMTGSLRQYFEALGLLGEQAPSASTSGE